MILRIFLSSFLVPGFLTASMNLSEIESWARQVENHIDVDAIEWAEKKKEEIVESKELELMSGETKKHFVAFLQENKCKGCASSNEILQEPEEEPLLVAMSFSVPEETWLSLSKEMEAIPSTFIVRGIPKNSFQEFSKKILQLKERGMNASVQIDPESFQNFSIEEVPSFILRGDGGYDKISGNLSLAFVLQKFSEEGELGKAKEFWDNFQKGGWRNG